MDFRTRFKLLATSSRFSCIDPRHFCAYRSYRTSSNILHIGRELNDIITPDTEARYVV